MKAMGASARSVPRKESRKYESGRTMTTLAEIDERLEKYQKEAEEWGDFGVNVKVSELVCLRAIIDGLIEALVASRNYQLSALRMASAIAVDDGWQTEAYNCWLESQDACTVALAALPDDVKERVT
jgi:hypothetical protein